MSGTRSVLFVSLLAGLALGEPLRANQAGDAGDLEAEGAIIYEQGDALLPPTGSGDSLTLSMGEALQEGVLVRVPPGHSIETPEPADPYISVDESLFVNPEDTVGGAKSRWVKMQKEQPGRYALFGSERYSGGAVVTTARGIIGEGAERTIIDGYASSENQIYFRQFGGGDFLIRDIGLRGVVQTQRRAVFYAAALYRDEGALIDNLVLRRVDIQDTAHGILGNDARRVFVLQSAVSRAGVANKNHPLYIQHPKGHPGLLVIRDSFIQAAARSSAVKSSMARTEIVNSILEANADNSPVDTYAGGFLLMIDTRLRKADGENGVLIKHALEVNRLHPPDILAQGHAIYLRNVSFEPAPGNRDRWYIVINYAGATHRALVYDGGGNVVYLPDGTAVGMFDPDSPVKLQLRNRVSCSGC